MEPSSILCPPENPSVNHFPVKLFYRLNPQTQFSGEILEYQVIKQDFFEPEIVIKDEYELVDILIVVREMMDKHLLNTINVFNEKSNIWLQVSKSELGYDVRQVL
jgi:hypothetical protein